MVSRTVRMSTRFEDRYVAFVDILGFRDIIKSMEREPKLFATIDNALKVISNQVKVSHDYKRSRETKRHVRGGAISFLPRISLQMSAFSDCYVISEETSAWRVVAAVQALASTL